MSFFEVLAFAVVPTKNTPGRKEETFQWLPSQLKNSMNWCKGLQVIQEMVDSSNVHPSQTQSNKNN